VHVLQAVMKFESDDVPWKSRSEISWVTRVCSAVASAPADEPADQPQTNGDAASEGDDANAAQEEPQLHRKPKASKKKKSKRDIGFDMLDEDEADAASSAAGE
jgi:hypothetical protein